MSPAIVGDSQARTHDARRTAIGASIVAATDQVKEKVQAKLGREQAEAIEKEQQQVETNPEGVGRGPQIRSETDHVEIICGPLLNYKHMSNATTASPRWHGTVLIVTKPGHIQPELQLRCLGPVRTGARTVDDGSEAATNGPVSISGGDVIKAVRLYEDKDKAFWRFAFEVPFQGFEARWEYEIFKAQYAAKAWEQSASGRKFAIFIVPAKEQSMRIMFHSCNGFSVGTDEEDWSGPALWNDVLRQHAEQPIHVMLGGGDQIYNDRVRVTGPLKPWTEVGNPKKRRDFLFGEDMRKLCDDFYFQNYVKWYSTFPFAPANASIPQLNIWDDHDIIDGFGSYTDGFMRCPVFRGLGGVAHKYYLLFQHHLAPPKSTFTTASPSTQHARGPEATAGADPNQLKDTFVKIEKEPDPSYIIGKRPGPYVEECSHSIYCQLGARIAFMGIDARTERTRHQVNYPETYELLFDRLNTEFVANPNIKHFILLLGIPIAYPRMQWLENILQSPAVGFIKFLNKRFGLAGGFFNQFDGNVDILDDLDDHYTAHQHKKERKGLILQLQEISQRHSVRITILGGDVHLGAFGRFYSKPSLETPPEKDHRYMANIISSAITNHPPPAAVANILHRRNKVHRLDHKTDETLVYFFNHDPGAENGTPKKTADYNHCTMPSRNYALITESHDFLQTNGTTTEEAASATESSNAENQPTPNGTVPTAEAQEDGAKPSRGHMGGIAANPTPGQKFNPRTALHAGEMNAGTKHPAASGLKKTGLCGKHGLDIALRVEIDHHDKEGHTEGYGFSLPALEAETGS